LAGLKIMMGHRQVEQAALFYEFSLERHIPADHLLRSIDRFVDLEHVRQDLAPFYSSIGRPSIDPELMIRMLLIGYCSAFDRSGACAMRSTSIWPIGGFAGWVWMAQSQTTRRSPRTGMAVSGRATSSVACSRACCAGALRSDWSAVRDLQLMRA
jgi:hypothetical protein